MICVDLPPRGQAPACIFSDGLQASELQLFAVAVGARRRFRRGEGSPEDRFEVARSLAVLALRAGARKVSSAERFQIWQWKRERARRIAA